MLFILAYTFAVRRMAKPKPLVYNTLYVSPCYSSPNCINVSAYIRETVRLPPASNAANVSERCIAQPSVLRNAAFIRLCCQFYESLYHAENFQLDIKGCEHHRRVIELPFRSQANAFAAIISPTMHPLSKSQHPHDGICYLTKGMHIKAYQEQISVCVL